MRFQNAAAVLTVLSIVASATIANAGTFTTTTFSGAGSELAILNTGTLVEANNFGTTSASSSVTVNGVTFGNSKASTNLAATDFDFPVTFPDTDLDTLMTGGSGVSSPLTVTIGGLTPGNDYRFQYVQISTNGNARNYTFTAEGDVTGPHAMPASTTVGDSVVYEWNAGDNTLNFQVATGFTQIAAYALFDVTPPPVPAPEPGTFILAAMGLVGLGMCRRRNRK